MDSAEAGAFRVLIVDDDPAVREVMAEQLGQAGYAVSEAGDGQQAMGMVEELDPHLVVIDFMMPGMTGAEVAAAVRAIRPTQKLLLVSGYLHSQAVERAFGDVPILKKPFDDLQLTNAVRALLERR